ncbi:MAG TPA: transporter substrate-binding domain-containing protein [Burkholderiales bacterium]|nr:transporter substrate-binding domain-containing protein [Burkholderiales bacterium]
MLKFQWPFVWVFAAVASGCAGGPIAPTPAAKSELAPSGTLRIAVFTGNPVIGSKGKAPGEVTGTTVALGRELAAGAGLPASVIEYTAVGKMVEEAKAGAWDIAVVAFDPARRNVVDFAPPHMVVDLTYLVKPGANIANVPAADRAGVRIVAARGAATALTLKRELKAATLVEADTEAAAFEMLRAGQVDALAQNRFLLLGLAERLPGSHVLEDRFAAAEMTIIMPHGRPAALAYVGAFIEEAKRSGAVKQAIDGAGLRGVAVAPATR